MNFDLNKTSLDFGACLIEASAGTGKTYTIAGLVLRLLIEKNLSVREILVVTYTNAATEELRSRIRDILVQAAKTFASGKTTNPFLHALYCAHQENAQEILTRLERSLCSFDEASIYSIHGFCQRTLKDRAFESGVLFDTELAADISNLLEEISEDYWRNHFYNANPLHVSFALKNKFSPKRFLPLLRSCLNYPAIKFLSPIGDRSINSIAEELAERFQIVQSIWTTRKAEIKHLFGSHQKKNWANTPYNDDEQVAEFFLRLEKCFATGSSPTDLECLDLFCNESLRAKTGKNKTPPEHAFFNACDALCKTETDFVLALQLDFVRFALQELPKRKEARKMQSFDDLLTRLHDSLRGPGANKLRGEIRRRYRAVLIDEFQDTDPIQYEIFRNLFYTGEHYLFLIGDPKQAIYGFRGADIFTYIKAANTVDRTFTLGHNWRSESGLVAAINTVFSHAPRPFVFEKIGFHQVQAKGEANRTPLTVGGKQQSPFELWFYPRGQDEKAVSKDSAETELPRIVAAEIARLLTGETHIGERRVRPEDIAVLVLENRQAQMMQEALNALGIPNVQQTNASLFEVREATELHRILLAVAQPRNWSLVKAALATDIIGLAADRIAQMTDDDAEWKNVLERFHRYFDLWTTRGFIQMFRAVLQQEKVRPHLLSQPDGERRLTNVLHLGEVLQRASTEQRLGVAGLLHWFAIKRTERNVTDDEYQLRLERDENAVKLVTVHKSKGLEYGIVFCPFSWKHSEISRGGEDVVFFHERDTGQLVRDLGSEQFDVHRELAIEEKLAENVRLLYVALTRAKHRCYFVWGHFYKAESSAPAWLLHRTAAPATSSAVDLKTLTDEAMRTDLAKLQTASTDAAGFSAIQVRDVPDSDAVDYKPAPQSDRALQPRTFTTSVRSDWRTTSYSSLTREWEDDTPDYDQMESAASQAAAGSIFSFPKGSKPGICLHEILEVCDFTETDVSVLKELVDKKLQEHGFAAEYSETVCQSITNALSVSLDKNIPGLKLCTVAAHDRIAEMEFYFPLRRISPSTFQDIFTRHNVLQTADMPFVETSGLTFHPVCGYLKGFIDLVFQSEGKFYIVDWKSNCLGNTVESYGPEALRTAMLSENYILQYHLYSLALHKYLESRLPGYDYAKHFGGVFYVFLRGLDPGRPEYGVFRDRPSDRLMRELATKLIRS